MSEIERLEISTRTKAMTDEEMAVCVRNMPTGLLLAEIDRRTTKASEVLNEVYNILGTATDSMTLEDMQAIIKALKGAVKG